MRLNRSAAILGIVCFLCGGALFARAQDAATQPDNTKVNKRDRRANEVTADQQKENTSDRELARKIRRAVVDDKNLSTYAHNVKIIVHNGQVTLKGPVHSGDEKKAIEAKAAEVAGADKVTNQISVKGDRKSDNS
jgi:hyperosmotically inducible protein